MFVFLLDCLRFSKLLKLHHTERRISNNLLKRKQSSKKISNRVPQALLCTRARLAT